MIRRLVLALSLTLYFASASCQSYTSGLQKTMTGADETAVIAGLHAVAVAQQTYSISNGGDYGTLQQLTEGGLLDARYNGSKPVKDYVLTMNVIPKSSGAPEGSYTCNADPDNQGTAGRHFYIDSTSTAIHVNTTQPATAQDPTAP